MKLDDFTVENSEQYLSVILESENIFPEPIRLDEEQLLRILNGDRPIAKVAIHGSRYIGNVLGFCPSEIDLKEMDLKGIVSRRGMLYLYNFVIIPQFQGRGFGKRIFQNLIETSRTKGYRALEGHCRPNASLHIARTNGVEILETYANWCDTGEDYVHCRLKL